MNAIEYLNISIEKMTAEEVILTMPIRDEIKQPYGIVHGTVNNAVWLFDFITNWHG